MSLDGSPMPDRTDSTALVLVPTKGPMAIDVASPPPSVHHPLTVAAPPAHRVADPQPAGEPAVPVLDAEPPEDALDAVQVAAEAYEVLRQAGRELRFQTSEDGVLRIDVYDGTGKLLRSIPPNEALAMASREASWRA